MYLGLVTKKTDAVMNYHVPLQKLYAKNGSHKLTACYKAYCTYKVRKDIVQEEPCYYRLLLLEVTMYSDHK